MPTQQDLSSVKVTKYLYPQWDYVGRGLHTSLKIRPRTCLEHVEVVLWIFSRICLPSRHGSHGWVHGSLSEIVILVTSPCPPCG
jgi:hypothetical protein